MNAVIDESCMHYLRIVNRLGGVYKICMKLVIAVLMSASFLCSAFAEEPSVEDRLKEAHAAFKAGKTDEAIAIAAKVIEQEPKNPLGHYFRGRLYSSIGKSEEAIRDFDAALKIEPREAKIYQLRGIEHFHLGYVKESAADLDMFVKLDPEHAPHCWQRGLALYYAGRFADGQKQFESHQKVNPNDVENVAWHFACVARNSNFEKAREQMLHIKNDGRVPMMQIYALLMGKGTPEDVLKAAAEGNPTPERLKQQTFYANLYLGLYYESAGDKAKAKEHILKAAEAKADEGFMSDCAAIHAKMLDAKAD